MSSESERDTHSTAASDFETEIGVLSHENEKWENLGNGAGEDVCITLKDGAGRSRARMSLIKLFEDASRRARNGIPLGPGISTPLDVFVHKLSYSVNVELARKHVKTVIQEVREKMNIRGARPESVPVQLLKDVSFYVRPKMMLLVIGPPGCGKSTIFNLLANRIRYGNVEGNVFFDENPIDPKIHNRQVSYVGQEDNHLPTLTVQETLEFAGQCLIDWDSIDHAFEEYVRSHPQEAEEELQILKKAVVERYNDADLTLDDFKSNLPRHVDIVLQLLGLSHRKDTIVGNDMIRGVSGGEKKRVTIGVEMMKWPRLFLMDEPTTGLDSSTAVELGKFWRILADRYAPVVVSLKQPPPKLYKKFDHVLLLHKGETCYFGPREQVLPYFQSLGFDCPTWLNEADFIVSLLDNLEEYRIPEHPILISDSSELAAAYAQSAFYRDEVASTFPPHLAGDKAPFPAHPKLFKDVVRRASAVFKSRKDMDRGEDFSVANTVKPRFEEKAEEMKEVSEMGEEEDMCGVDTNLSFIAAAPAPSNYITEAFHQEDLQPFARSKWRQYCYLVQRGNRQTLNFPAMIVLMSLYSLYMALFFGTVYLQLGHDQSDLQNRTSATFNIVLVMAFKALSSLPKVFDARNVFEWQLSQRYYSVLPYWAAEITAYLPLLLVDVTVFASISYWMIGLNDDDGGSRFWFLMLLSPFLVLTCDGWMKAIAQLNSDIRLAQGIGPFGLGVLLLFGGFFRSLDNMPDWSRWITYLSPFRWAYQGLITNEFMGATFYCNEGELVPKTDDPLFNMTFEQGGYEGNQACPITTGEEWVENAGFDPELSERWYSLLWLAIMAAVMQATAFLCYKFIRHGKVKRRLMASELAQSSKINGMNVDVEDQVTTRPAVTVEFINVQYSVKTGEKREHDKRILLESGMELQDFVEEEEKPKQGVEKEKPVEGILSCLPCCGRGEKIEDDEWQPLITNISGYIEPGMMVALMGPSGAGKSTLLDVLSGRKTAGRMEGAILFNGIDKDPRLMRYAGYCEQQDLHNDTATVREAVELSARCRLPPSWSLERRSLKVEETLRKTRLEEVQGLLVSELRMEQRKRLTVAVELVTNPAVLFLDEPTSGLDASEAASLMRIIGEEARRGMAVCCTIHQPSAQIYSHFTHMLLMRSGGRVIYFGETGESMMDYLRDNLDMVMEEHDNPADFALVAASPLPGSGPDPADIWDESEERKQVLENSPSNRDTDEEPIGMGEDYEDKYAASFLVQSKEVVKRAFKAGWRRPEEVRLRCLKNVVAGLATGFVFFDLQNDQTDIRCTASIMFVILIISTFNAFPQISTIMRDRPSFYRERASGTYRAVCYLLGLVLSDIPYVFLTVLLFAIPAYFMAGLDLDGESIVYFIIVGFGLFIMSMILVQSIAIFSPNEPLASLIGGAVITLLNTLTGFLVIKDQIPDYWIWGYYGSVIRYPIEGLSVSQLSDNTYFCENNEGAVAVPMMSNMSQVQYYCPITSGEQLIDIYSMDTDHQYWFLGATYGIYLVLFAMCWWGLGHLSYLNR